LPHFSLSASSRYKFKVEILIQNRQAKIEDGPWQGGVSKESLEAPIKQNQATRRSKGNCAGKNNAACVRTQ